MKKFLIFLVAIVVCVCVGMTTYYFLRNDETINFKTKEIYCNAGDVITLKELGFERIKADKDTKINYNAGGDAVTSYVKYDSDKGYYVVGQNGGNVTLVIKTTNKKFKNFKVTVHIGNGTQANPYYIDDETSLSKIGQTYSLDEGTYYDLRNDIIVSKNFKGIGYNANAGQWIGFSGNFNGNGYTISGATLNATGANAMGLFSTINEKAVVENLIVKNVNVVGDYAKAGVLAGEIKGTVSNVGVKNSEITNTNGDANIGAFAGEISLTGIKTSYAKKVEINASGANAVVGGLFGVINEADVHACYASKVNIVANNASTVAGFAGKYNIGTTSGSILQSYANTTSSNANFAGFIGEINSNASFDVEKASMLRFLIGNIAVSNGNVVKTVNVPNKSDSTPFFTSFEDETNGYYLISNYSNENELVLETELTYYEIDPETENSKVLWDANVWINSDNMLPELKMNKIAPAGVSGEYLRRNLSKIYVDDAADIIQVSDREFVLTNNITLPQGWTPINLNNVTFNGKDFTIYFNDNGNTSLFGTVTDSTIKNVKLENVKLTSNSNGALASSITATDAAFVSTVENVKITYIKEVTTDNTFGGLTASATNAIIKDCSVEGLNVGGASSKVAGLVADIANSTISNCAVEATLAGLTNIAGVVVNNNLGTISNVTGSIVINYSAVSNNATLAGVVNVNSGNINGANLTVKIDVQNAGSTVVTGGVVANNNGSINDANITGEGILVSGSFDEDVVLGGITAYNNGTIANSYCLINQVGTYRVGRNDVVGGVTAYNNTASSIIEKVVVSADLYGNTVGGVVAYMDSSAEAKIDQVLVAKFDKVTKTITDNTIKGDKFVAGVAVELSAGTISNVQTSSNIIGATNETVSSLVVLVFPDGAKLANATINNSFEGNGNFFRETWKVATSTNTDEFGTLENDGRYNLYGYDAHVGSMHSVVINTEKASSKGVHNITKAEFTGSKIWVRLDYGDKESSFYKTANNGEFENSATFKTDWVENQSTGLFGWGNKELRRQMTFDIGGVWSEVNGISLSFLYA